MQVLSFQEYHRAEESRMGLEQVKNATKFTSFTEIDLFFSFVFFVFNKHSLDCCKPLGNFRSYEKVDSYHFASFLLLLWRREFSEVLILLFLLSTGQGV